MKITKTTLGMETLNARYLMSASPLGIAAPPPEPPASDSLSYNFSGIDGGYDQGKVALPSLPSMGNLASTMSQLSQLSGATDAIWVGTAESYGKQNKLQEVRSRAVADIDKASGGAVAATIYGHTTISNPSETHGVRKLGSIRGGSGSDA